MQTPKNAKFDIYIIVTKKEKNAKSDIYIIVKKKKREKCKNLIFIL